MKKILASVLTGVLVTPVWISVASTSVNAEKEKTYMATEQTQKENEESRTGLLGYYFKGANFNDLVTFAPTYGNTLMYNSKTANQLLDKNQQTYQSIRWIGFIKSKETGNFTFKLSDDAHAVIEVEGKVVSNQGKEKQSVHIEKEKLVPIKIEYRSNTPLQSDTKLLQNLKLYKMDQKRNVIPIEQEDLRNPNYNETESRDLIKSASKATLFKGISADDESKDTDGDSIPDVWEENGYTIQNKVAVKWTDELTSKGYTKFVSNPFEAHTVGDPYTDYEKAARDLDSSNAKETFNPLVAAFPSINVGLEKIILSSNKDLTNSVGSNTSNNWSYTNTEGASVEAGIGSNGVSFGVSANYQHSATVGVEWGHSTEDTTHINSAESAFINANVRYHNVGTGSIYDVKPTTSFVLNDSTIGTIQAKENTTALRIPAGKSYPIKGQHGISINTMDDFDSRPIPLNKEQLNEFLNNQPIMLETNQVGGHYMKKNENGALIPGGDWNGVIEQIKERTASIIINDGNNISEKRVAAKDYEDLEDKTPSLTLKEALKLGYPDDIKENDGLLYYQDRPIYESSVMTYLDENTAKEVIKQINDTSENYKDVKTLYDVKLEPKMNFTIRLAVLYDGAEENSNSGPIGEWYYTYQVSGGNTGKRQYKSAHPGASLEFSQKAKNILKKNSKYYLSMYMKADADTEPIIEIQGGNAKIIKTQKAKLNNQGYQRVDILINNTEATPIENIVIRGDGQTNVFWDDVSITEVAAITPDGPADEEFKKSFEKYTENISKHPEKPELDYKLNAVIFDNVNEVKNYIEKYRVEYKAYGLPSVDQTRKSNKVQPNGNVTVNMLEYNDNKGLNILTPSYKITIYAITKGGREIPVYHRTK
ncbi:PA14 domain-containing protein [Bacillus cereus]|nr:binary toxin-like calcium binding domain-containing protein [Bacillus cereus]MCM3222910.1 PA14 domain-containing protein [Bacillus cereus]MEC3336043.1 PA14 domain-containing protein [Bacillus cereus]